MNIWIIIGIGIVAIVGVCYAIYKRKINHAREQQRLTLTQNISHELKTPVASIRGALETILMHPDMDEDQRRQFIERAYQQSGRLANLVEDISTINKLDTQTDFYTRLQLDLHTVVENVVQDLSLRAMQAGAIITHNIPKHLIISGNYTSSGFDNTITMMVGVDKAGAVSGISIIDHSETAGLGAVAAATTAAGEAFRAQFKGLTGTVSVTKDGGQVDAITSATITSRAVCAGVNAALAVAAKMG